MATWSPFYLSGFGWEGVVRGARELLLALDACARVRGLSRQAAAGVLLDETSMAPPGLHSEHLELAWARPVSGQGPRLSLRQWTARQGLDFQAVLLGWRPFRVELSFWRGTVDTVGTWVSVVRAASTVWGGSLDAVLARLRALSLEGETEIPRFVERSSDVGRSLGAWADAEGVPLGVPLR